MEKSIFTKIINGELPAHKVYEDDQVIAFLDIEPFTTGHTLVIPKKQIDHLWDIEDPLYEHLMKVAKTIANKQREVFQPERVAMLLEGFAVPHAHVHVFPAYEGLEETIANKIAAPSNEELAKTAAQLVLS